MRSSHLPPMSFATSCAGEGSCRMPLALLSLLPACAHSVVSSMVQLVVW